MTDVALALWSGTPGVVGGLYCESCRERLSTEVVVLKTGWEKASFEQLSYHWTSERGTLSVVRVLIVPQIGRHAEAQVLGSSCRMSKRLCC